MYFEDDSINKKLQCPICNKRFQDPIFLPCEQHVCQKCINDYIEENLANDQKQFNCLWCDKEHAIPANGFPKSELMNFWLELKPKKVNRGRAIENFNENVNKCANKINEIKQSLVNKENFLKDQYELKRHKIQTETYSKIDKINKRSREQLDRMNQLEKEHLESLADQTKRSWLMEICFTHALIIK